MGEKPRWRLRLHQDFRRLEPVKDLWNTWAGDRPFLRWEWLATWWEVYGDSTNCRRGPRLWVLSIGGDRDLFGFVPLYSYRHPLWGWTVSWLGSGEVCSDYLEPIAPREHTAAVTQAMAEALHAIGMRRFNWGETCLENDGQRLCPIHRLDLDGILSAGPFRKTFQQCLESLGWSIECRPIDNAWQIRLPATFEDYLAAVCKKKMRQLYRRLLRRYFSDPALAVKVVEGADDWRQAFETLVDLHQKRREQLGDEGRFASWKFAEFHRRVLREYLPQKRARLILVEWHGRPIAAEYLLLAGDSLLGYQSGIDPTVLDLSPGHLANLAVLQAAIAEGYRWLDLLRGDEPYKSAMGAQPKPLVRLQAAPPRAVARLRFQLWKWGRASRRFLSRRGPPAEVASLAYAHEHEGDPGR